jgi:hypothetical protein
MKTPRNPEINLLEKFWFKYDSSIKLTGWLVVLMSALSGFIVR